MSGRSIAIIGGAGLMGEWFARFFKSKGYAVVISGRRYAKCRSLARKLGVSAARTNSEAASRADLVLISVLPSNFEKVVREIAPALKPGQRVIDVTSLKVLPVRIMHRYIRENTVLGTHPMFGPSAGAKGQNFILTPTNAAERRFAREFGRFLSSSGFSVRVISPERHDEIIGRILSLTHFVGLVTADTWRELGIERYMGMSSTSFRFLMQFAKSVVDSSPELYSYIQMDVPKVADAERVFLRSAARWRGMVKARKRAAFVKRMKILSAYLGNLDQDSRVSR